MKATKHILAFTLLFAAASCEKEDAIQKKQALIEKDTFQSNSETQSRSNPLLDSLFSYFQDYYHLDSLKIMAKYGNPDSITNSIKPIYEGGENVLFTQYFYDSFSIQLGNNKGLHSVVIKKDIAIGRSILKIGMRQEDLISILDQPSNTYEAKDELILEYTLYKNDADELFFFYFNKHGLTHIDYYGYMSYK